MTSDGSLLTLCWDGLNGMPLLLDRALVDKRKLSRPVALKDGTS